MTLIEELPVVIAISPEEREGLGVLELYMPVYM